MAYDEKLAERLRKIFATHPAAAEKKMFGGLAMMVHGNMCCGVVGSDLMVRVGADGYEEALSQPHARPMDFTGRPMKGFVFVDGAGIATDANLEAWVKRALDFVLTQKI